ncbi:SEL1-like repeat protein [Pseudomonas citronellolis]|uniref:SEL1-like repeat protein n=1 Tax=Pseudomonas citronellolis TaxID=53408 RepID=UPI001EDC87B5|nr:sel1 repeat family protein [Pseudomonas humi]
MALLPGLGGCFEDQAPPAQAAYANLAFACRHESDNLPGLDREADRLYRYGLFIERRPGAKDFDAAARYYRISAALGHYKANGRLQDLVSQGMAASPDAPRETIALARQLIDQGVPGGYYDMGHYLSLGYGVEQDDEKSRRYIRRSADLGNPDAQYYVAELLGRIVGPKDDMVRLRRCAMEQGHAEGASALAGYLQALQDYPEAVKAYQEAVRSGHSLSAYYLGKSFAPENVNNELYRLGLVGDKERSRRYSLISKFLEIHEYQNPKVPDVDQIVPLPPAKLPEWDGTFQWLKEREAAGDPEKPSEELVERLAREKQLDPKTGLPLSGEFSRQG